MLNLKIKPAYKGEFIPFKIRSGNDWVSNPDGLPSAAVEELLRTEEDCAMEGPKGFSVRIGEMYFLRKAFDKPRSNG